MAVLAGWLEQAPIGGMVNPRLSIHMNGFAVDYWPSYAANIEAPVRSALTTHWPVSAAPREISGRLGRDFSDDWYHRIHVIPRVLALGNIVSTQVEEVAIWNAWLVPVTLLTIDGVEEGMTLDGPDDFPIEFMPLRMITWDVSVSTDGPSSIDTTLVWSFDDVPDGRLLITGIRIIAWTMLPNWSAGIRERLIWETDVLPSEERKEQRRAMRIAPRRSFQAELIIEDRERSLFDLQMHGWGGRVWALPMWHDIQLLSAPVALGATTIVCSTTGRDFRAGGLAMLRGESAFRSETVEIDSVSAGALTLVRPTLMAWPARTRLYPVRTARFDEQPRTRRLTDRALTVQARFELVEPSDWPEAVLPLYRGLPVYDARPDESEDLTGTFERMLAALDNGSGIPFVVDAAEMSFTVQAHRWVLNGITEHSDFRAFLYALRGRQVSFWLPTHADDLTLLSTVGSASTVITVANVGYARFGLNQRGRRDIRIQLRNGTVFMRRIANAIEIDADSEQLTIDTALGQSVAPTDVWRISFLMLARSQSDEVEIAHVTDIEGVATSTMTFVGVNDE